MFVPLFKRAMKFNSLILRTKGKEKETSKFSTEKDHSSGVLLVAATGNFPSLRIEPFA